MSTASALAVKLSEDLVTSPWLPSYPKHEVQMILDECKHSLHLLCSAQNRADALDDEEKSSDAPMCGWRAWRCDIFRVKRALLVYHKARLRRIRETRWSCGRMFSDEQLSKMSPSEVDYLNKYNDIIDDHSQGWLKDESAIDLGTDAKCWYEPIALVRITQGNGTDEVPTSDGKTIKLIKDQQYRVRTVDAEIFVQNKVATVVNASKNGTSETPGAQWGR